MSNRKFRTGASLAVMATLAMAAPGMARAQSANAVAAADTPDSQGIADIVVTAQKHATTVEKTPISMNVVTPEVITENDIRNLEDLIEILPTVEYTQYGQNSFIGIRGVTNQNQNETASTDVSISIDGNYYNRALGLNISTFDLERVEVLKGPQGTLHGRTATGGAINFITAKPTKTFTAYFGAGYGAYDEFNTEGMVSGPIADWLQVRAAFQTTSHGGYWNNAPAKDTDSANSKAGRITFAFQPARGLTGDVAFEKIISDTSGGSVYGYPANGYNNFPTLPTNHTWPLPLPSQDVRINSWAVRGNLRYQFADGLALQYTGGYRHLDFNGLIEYDGQLDHQGPLGGSPYFNPQHEIIGTDNQELYLTSITNNPHFFDFQLGVDYFKEQENLYSNLAFEENGVLDPGLVFVYPKVGNQGKAVFGQVSIRPLSNVTIEAGARYNKDNQFEVGYFYYPLLGVPNTPLAEFASSTKTTYHGAVNWQVTPHSLLYAKIDTGYKPGGYSQLANFGPETVTSYELGSKNRLLHDTLQINAAFYYYDYSHIQINQLIQGFDVVTNAGTERLYGVDADAVFQPNKLNRFNVDLLYNRAYFVNSIIEGINVSGLAPPAAPRWSGNAGYEHTFLLNNDGEFVLRGQIHAETKTNLGYFQYNSEERNGFQRIDAFLTYHAPDNRYTIGAYVKNLTNKLILTAAIDQTSLFGSYVYQFAAPRTFGVDFRVNFR